MGAEAVDQFKFTTPRQAENEFQQAESVASAERLEALPAADPKSRTSQLKVVPPAAVQQRIDANSSDDAASRRGMAPARLDDDRSELPQTSESNMGLSPVPSGLSQTISGVSQIASAGGSGSGLYNVAQAAQAKATHTKQDVVGLLQQ